MEPKRTLMNPPLPPRADNDQPSVGGDADHCPDWFHVRDDALHKGQVRIAFAPARHRLGQQTLGLRPLVGFDVFLRRERCHVVDVDDIPYVYGHATRSPVTRPHRWRTRWRVWIPLAVDADEDRPVAVDGQLITFDWA